MLEEFKRKCFLQFLEKLLMLKSQHELYDFQNLLDELHHCFLVLINSFEIKALPDFKDEILEESDSTNIIKVNEFELFVVDNFVIDINDKYKGLAKIFVNKTLEEAKILGRSLYDYNFRCCDHCGLYFLKPHFETPLIRIKKDDFYLTLHKSCNY